MTQNGGTNGQQGSEESAAGLGMVFDTATEKKPRRSSIRIDEVAEQVALQVTHEGSGASVVRTTFDIPRKVCLQPG
jgi:hypothetical protein